MTAAIWLMATMIAIFTPVPVAAADAVGCLNRCSARCYGKQNPGACEQSCNAYCISQPDETPQVCGSIVVADGANESIGWSWRTSSQAAAERGAWKECIRNAPSCRPVITFCNQCATVVRAWDGRNLLGSFGSRRVDAGEAERAAMAQCQERFPKASCKTAKRVCADRGPG